MSTSTSIEESKAKMRELLDSIKKENSVNSFESDVRETLGFPDDIPLPEDPNLIIKRESKTMDSVNEKAMAAVTSDGIILPQDSELLKMMQADSKLGAENIGAGSIPLLKVYQPGKTVVEMPNGRQPNDGWFWYQSTQSQFETVTCHILSISRGYKAKPKNANDKEKFTQLLSGAMEHEGKLLPFMMYLTGLKLAPMWSFGKMITKFTKNCPMFAFKTKLSTEKVKTDYGYTYIVNYDLVVNDLGFPEIINDKTQYEYLRDKVGVVEETMESVIRNGESEEADTFKNIIN